MAKLKIAMLTTFLPPYSFGGDAIAVSRLAAALSKAGHDITIIHDIDAFNTLSDGPPPDVKPPENVRIIGLLSKFGSISNLLTHQMGRPVIHRSRLQGILKPGAFDILWFHNISLIGGPGILSYGDGLKVYEAHEHWLVCPAHVLWRHNRELCDQRQCFRCELHYRRPPQLWRYQKFFNRQLSQVDTFIAKSEFSRNKHKEFGFLPGMKVVPYFLPDNSEARQIGASSPNDRPYFLFVGRLEKIKGLDEIIPVFADYPHADLLVLGGGRIEPVLRRKAAGIDNVKFLGRQSPEDLSKYYQSAIALIVPSVGYETFGIILIEAFRAGTPVIARKLGPFVEIVNQCGGGLLFSDNSELAKAMHRLQSDSTYREGMSRAARSGFEKHWSEEAVLKQYNDVLLQAAKAKGNDYVASVLKQET